jgi:sugar (pentulose or hexulose) kinase
MKYFLGIDTSTTATKALLLEETGRVAGTASATYPYETPRPLWSEQSPSLWWNGTAQSIKKVLEDTGISPKSILAVGLTGQMHGLVLLDEDGEVLRPSILWNDQRTKAQCDEIRAAWVGLTVRHTRAHMTRAVLEGVAFGIKDSFSLIQSAGLGAIEQVRISGGGAKSPLWRQIMADVLGVELVTVNTTEGAAFGAALLAGVGAGVYASVPAACEATIQITGRMAPTAASEKYQQYYPRYRALYPALKDEFLKLGEL